MFEGVEEVRNSYIRSGEATNIASTSDTETQSIICPICSRRVMIIINIKENWTKFYTLTSAAAETDDHQKLEEKQQQQKYEDSEQPEKQKEFETNKFPSSSSASTSVSVSAITLSPLNKKRKLMTMMLDDNNTGSTDKSNSNNGTNNNSKDLGDGDDEQSEMEEEPAYTLVKCTSCDKCIGLMEKDIKNGVQTLEEILYNETKIVNGWSKAEGERDRRILFILSQLIYKQYEMPEESQLEVEFAFPPSTDLVKLLWINKIASGFFSLKLKGTLDLITKEMYSMVTLDTIFVRTAFRRHGYASAALENILTEFPGQNIGFSYPISHSMEKVLSKHLQLRPQDRLHFWEISGCGTQGNCRNLWLILQKIRKKKDETKDETVKE